MIYIAFVAVIVVLLFQFTGAIPDSSVGGPMTIALIFLAAALAVGVHEAWSKRRGVGGWVLSIVTALVGGIIAASLGSMVLEMILPNLGLEGSLASTRHPMLYIGSAAMMLLTILGAWFALWVAGQLR